jgi:hypothetical protein
MIHIRAIAQRQINLDRCAGAAVLDLREFLSKLKASNQRIEVARLATLPLLPTPSGPAALELFKQLLRVESWIQQSIRVVWIKHQVQWDTLPGLGCKIHDRPQRSPYPEFEFEVVEPEASVFETQSSRFLASLPREIRLKISVARLKTEALLRLEQNHEWSVQWSE